MGKSILVIDTPNCCGECKMSGTGVCRKWNTKDLRTFPKDCPLKKIPNKTKHPDSCDNGRYDKGWNDCIDKIFKRVDGNE